MGDNGYVMRRDGNVIEASFTAHRRPAVDPAAGNHVQQFGLIDPAKRREQIRDRKVAIAILPGKVWEEVSGVFRRQCSRTVDLAALGIDITMLQQSVQRIFGKIGIVPQQILVMPCSKTEAEILIPAGLFYEKRPQMSELALALRTQTLDTIAR